MCAALTAERVQSEGSVGADQNTHDVARESHAPVDGSAARESVRRSC